MQGSALKYNGHIIVQLYDKDVLRLKQGERLEYVDSFNDSTLIKKLRFQVKETLPEPKIFMEPGFYRKYYPSEFKPEKVTTCIVKIDKTKFNELLNKNWIGTRHGTNHLHIYYCRGM